jgi:hypothetical protein
MNPTKYERLLIRSGAELVSDGSHRQWRLNGMLFTLSRSRRMTPCQEKTFIGKLRKATRLGGDQ